MKPINLFLLTRIKDLDNFYNYEKIISDREEILNKREHEKNSLISFVDLLMENELNYYHLNNFYYSYSIPQIGKEFDLIKIFDDSIINIELKSKFTSEEKILNQLKRNKYYLSYLSKEISSFTYVENQNIIYKLTNDELIKVDILEIVNLLKVNIDYQTNINSLFNVSDYLVSPLNEPDRFINHGYFLTPNQEYIRSKIINDINNKVQFIGIYGSAGTGKTLLLYDIAFYYSKCLNICVIHCGILSEGHNTLAQYKKSLDIYSAKDINSEFNIDKYDIIFIDESQRFYKKQFDIVIKGVTKFNKVAIFSYDDKQTLSMNEESTNIVANIEKLSKYKKYELSKKIRTNKEISSFIHRLFDLNSNDKYDNYDSISLVYANDIHEANILLDTFINSGYTFINYTKSSYRKGSFDNFNGKYNTHEVIGQEFDNVVILLDNMFIYYEGKLRAYRHPNPNYLYRKLLYQGVTRVRKKLALIIIKNEKLFKNILSIL